MGARCLGNKPNGRVMSRKDVDHEIDGHGGAMIAWRRE
jgi:hypothetical protein